MALKTRIQQTQQPQNQFMHDLGEGLSGLIDPQYLSTIISSYLPQPNIISPLAKDAQSLIPGSARGQVLAAQTSPSPTPTPDLPTVTRNINNGFVKYGMDTQTAQQVAPSFAQAGQGLPDPYLPATIALKESSGGRTSQGKNNWINIMEPGTDTPIDYPDMQTALNGGNGHRGFKGILTSGIYDDYLKSGDLHDFFKHYTPASDPRNADYDTQIQSYNQLRSNFTGNPGGQSSIGQ